MLSFMEFISEAVLPYKTIKSSRTQVNSDRLTHVAKVGRHELVIHHHAYPDPRGGRSMKTMYSVDGEENPAKSPIRDLNQAMSVLHTVHHSMRTAVDQLKPRTAWVAGSTEKNHEFYKKAMPNLAKATGGEYSLVKDKYHQIRYPEG